MNKRSRFLTIAFIALLILITGFSISYFLIRKTQEGYSCIDCNVVIFTIDTLRADHVSSYGYFQNTITIPNIEMDKKTEEILKSLSYI